MYYLILTALLGAALLIWTLANWRDTAAANIAIRKRQADQRTRNLSAVTAGKQSTAPSRKSPAPGFGRR
jgi:hypothetical protein